jgi:hypothetical protein
MPPGAREAKAEANPEATYEGFWPGELADTILFTIVPPKGVKQK